MEFCLWCSKQDIVVVSEIRFLKNSGCRFQLYHYTLQPSQHDIWSPIILEPLAMEKETLKSHENIDSLPDTANSKLFAGLMEPSWLRIFGWVSTVQYLNYYPWHSLDCWCKPGYVASILYIHDFCAYQNHPAGKINVKEKFVVNPIT